MKKATVIIVILLVIVSIGIEVAMSFNDHTYTITITDKERVNVDDDSKYLVFGKTSNGEVVVLENTDTLVRGKFNSSNLYGQIEIGQTYTFTVVGFRFPLFSIYENIIKIS